MTARPYAKLFETEHGQILMEVQQDGAGSPYVRVRYPVADDRALVELTFPMKSTGEQAWVDAYEVLDTTDCAEVALTMGILTAPAVAHVLEAML